jgi:hypothetical protein
MREEKEDNSVSRKLSLAIVTLNLTLAGSLYEWMDQRTNFPQG